MTAIGSIAERLFGDRYITVELLSERANKLSFRALDNLTDEEVVVHVYPKDAFTPGAVHAVRAHGQQAAIAQRAVFLADLRFRRRQRMSLLGSEVDSWPSS